MHLSILKSRYTGKYHRIKKIVRQGISTNSKSAASKSTMYGKDKWVKLIGSFAASHYIEVLGREESLFYLLLQKFYYVDVLSGFCIALIVWELISQASRYLDSRFAWDEQAAIRLPLQVILGVFIPSVLIHILTYLQFTYIIGQKMADTTWYIYELPVCIMVIILINTYYLTYYFYDKYQLLKHNAAIPKPAVASTAIPSLAEPPVNSLIKKKRQVIIINKGQRNIPLPVEEIAYFYKKEENNYLRTFASEAYLIDESLEDIYSQLDECLFFRANRQTIINFQACKYYSFLEHGKLEVALTPASDEPVIISQKRSPLFKEWVSR